MTKQALQATSSPQELRAGWLAEWEEEARNIAGAIDWEQVQEVARRNPALPPFLATYVGDRSVREGLHASVSPLHALEIDTWVIATVEIEATSPSYLDVPAVLARFARDVRFMEARPSGRLVYRMAMYQEVVAELDRARCRQAVRAYGREIVRKYLHGWQGEWYRLAYAPRRFERHEVFDLVDSFIRPRDRRQAVSLLLSWRVGMAVGFLSALSVAQAQEAQEGMVILAGLVAPLLEQEASVGDRVALPVASVTSQGKRGHRASVRRK